MRRLLTATLLAAAAYGTATPATAAPVCYDTPSFGIATVGACAGTRCPDKCFVVVEPHCQTYVFLAQPCALIPSAAR